MSKLFRGCSCIDFGGECQGQRIRAIHEHGYSRSETVNESIWPTPFRMALPPKFDSTYLLQTIFTYTSSSKFKLLYMSMYMYMYMYNMCVYIYKYIQPEWFYLFVFRDLYYYFYPYYIYSDFMHS